jgi:malate permease and related proteins
LLTRSVVYSEWFVAVLGPLAWSLGPVALVSVGFQLRLNRALLQTYEKPLLLGLTYKLFLGPAVIALLYAYTFSVGEETYQITVVESAMPPMITAAIIANEYGLDADLTSLMVGLGIPLSLLSVTAWALLLR